MKEITLGSLFDGIGGFPYAASFYGIRSLWASEIEAACVSVTKRHFPEMEHLGDITKVHGGRIAPVDIITFGSPCQGLSMAGLRKGLADDRSGLFLEAVRIIDEMKEATDGEYPKFALWENVPGALSSAGGCDYQTVLKAFTKARIPMPFSGKWANAGMVRGGGADLAWCVYDAQYFGTAQRRRRVFLVADFRGERAGEILFVPKSLQGYSKAGRTAEKTPAAPDEGGTGADRRGNGGSVLTDDSAYCISGHIIGRNDNYGGNGAGYLRESAYTLTASDQHAVCAPARHDQCGNGLHGEAVGINGNLAAPLHASYCKGTGERCGQERDVVLCAATGQSRAEIMDNRAPALTCACEHPYIVRQHETGRREEPEDNSRRQTACDGSRGKQQTLSYYVRRLTPVECERLQGLPDEWTKQGEDGKTISDTKRYQMLGNSIAVPCAAYIMQGICTAMGQEEGQLHNGTDNKKAA